MLAEELGEGRNRNVESIGAIVLFQASQLGLSADTIGLLVSLQGRLRVGIDAVDEGAEGSGLFVEEEATLLEKE